MRAMRVLLFIMMGGVGWGQLHTSHPSTLGPYSTALNFSVDFSGAQAFYQSFIEFHPPSGYRTRVIKVYGDFIAWSYLSLPLGTSVEVGWGLKTTAPDGSTRITYPQAPYASPYDNSFVWVQGMLTSLAPQIRIPFSYKVQWGGLLASDNILISQPFIALNTTGLSIHLEPTFILIYQYESLAEQGDLSIKE